MAELNLKSRTIFNRDNLEVLRGINSNCIDLIYLDPPFNKNKKFVAPLTSSAMGASFSDIFRKESVKDEWLYDIKRENEPLHDFIKGSTHVGKEFNKYYLIYMAVRLIEMKRVLKDTGSIYLHCDHTMSHYLKLLMDCVFSEDNFQNEIVWCYRTGGASKKRFSRKHDSILFYSKDKHTFNTSYERIYYDKKFFTTKIDAQGRYYADVIKTDWWIDIKAVLNLSKNRTDYPTQKPLALLERIINSSSNEGDVVLDPFCGCATTCVAAEKLRRKWVGIDVSYLAYDLVKKRISEEASGQQLEFEGKKYTVEEPTFLTSPPVRSDTNGDESKHGYIYIVSNEAFPKSYKIGIANDPKKRLGTYQTSDPKRGYKLDFHLQTEYNAQIEKKIHALYKSPHEWIATDDVKKVAEEIIEYDKNLKSGKVSDND